MLNNIESYSQSHVGFKIGFIKMNFFVLFMVIKYMFIDINVDLYI